MSDLAIDVYNLSKTFGEKKVVHHIDIQVPKGKVYGFLGPNGSGKTTTLRMLCGLLTPHTGKGTCLGYDVRTQSENIRRHTGYMTQKFSYWESLTIRENLQFIAELFDLDHPRIRVHECLEKMGLVKRQNELAGHLSGGWKQRLALAACTLHNPELLLLDEPTAGVDPKARREFWDEIHNMAASGLTVLVSTHYMDEAQRCHEIIYIAHGHMMVKGTVEEVIQSTGLITWVVKGPHLSDLQTQLLDHPAVSGVTHFGDGLHVNGLDPHTLLEAIAPYRHSYEWQLTTPVMEDAFIHYMNKANMEVRS